METIISKNPPVQNSPEPEDIVQTSSDTVQKKTAHGGFGSKKFHLPNGAKITFEKGLIHFGLPSGKTRFATKKDVEDFILKMMKCVEERSTSPKPEDTQCESFHPENLVKKDGTEGVAICLAWEGWIQNIIGLMCLMVGGSTASYPSLKDVLSKVGQVPTVEKIQTMFNWTALEEEKILYSCPGRFHEIGNFDLVLQHIKKRIHQILFNNINQCLAQKIVTEMEVKLTKPNVRGCREDPCSIVEEMITTYLSSGTFGTRELSHYHSHNWWKNNRQRVTDFVYGKIWEQAKRDQHSKKPSGRK